MARKIFANLDDALMQLEREVRRRNTSYGARLSSPCPRCKRGTLEAHTGSDFFEGRETERGYVRTFGVVIQCRTCGHSWETGRRVSDADPHDDD